jgi:hypothetical protein
MNCKRLFAIALFSGTLWLCTDQIANAQYAPPKDDGSITGTPRQDHPSGQPRAQRDAASNNEDWDNAGSQPEERRQPGPGRQGPFPGQGQGTGMMRGPGGYGGMQGYGAMGMGGFMRRQDPDLIKEAELDRKIQDLCEKYRHAPDTAAPAPGPKEETRAEIQKQIEKLVTEQFDIRHERRVKELKRFEEQIKRLRETIQKREELKAEIISRHMKELLEQEDEMKF